MSNAVIQFRGTIYENGYGQLSLKVMKDTTLNKQSRLIYAYMCAYAGGSLEGERTAFPSIDLQCHELGMSPDTYYKHRKPLIDRGLITIEKRRQEGSKFENNLYYINAVVNEPKKEEEKPKKPAVKVSKPYPKKPYTENSDAEKSGTITKNTTTKNNTKINNKDLDLKNNLNKLNLPFQLKKYISNNLHLIKDDHGQGQFLIADIEKYFTKHQNMTIKEHTKDDEFLFLSHAEFAESIIRMFQTIEKVESTTYGLVKRFVDNKLSFKHDDYFDSLETEQAGTNINPDEFVNGFFNALNNKEIDEDKEARMKEWR